MVKSQRIDILLEKNRSGKPRKIESFKDKDHEDTTLTFWVKQPNGELVKAGEYIVKDDQSLPPKCGDDEIFDEATQKCVPKPPVENKAPVIEGPTLINARIGSPVTINITVSDPDGDPVSIAWRQVLPEPKDLAEFDNSLLATLTYDTEGDYLVQVEAKDDHNNSTDLLINIKARDEQVPPPSDFQTLIAATGDTDANKTSIKGITMAGKAPSVIFGGDGPYNESDPQGFVDAWKKNVSKEHTAVAIRGNHDALEDSNQATRQAMDQFFDWPPDGPANQATKVNNVGLIGMDTQDDKIGDESGSQYKFVAATLETFKADPAVDFIIVCMHKPIYGHGYKHADEKTLRSVYHPLFTRYGVDIVYEFHNHNFWNTFPINIVNGVITKVYKELSEAGSTDIIYDFSQDHGVIFWGAGGGGHDLYKIDEANLPEFIRETNDADFGISEIAIDKNNTKNLRIRNVSQAGKVLQSVILRKGAQGPPQKQPPIIAGGPPNDNLIVAPKGNATIDLNVYDQDGGTVSGITWQFSPADKIITPTYSPDKDHATKVVFTVGEVEEDITARIVATDNDGLMTGKTILIHVRKAPPAGDYEGTLIFDSKLNWTPPDGKDHIIVAEVGAKNHKDGRGDMDGWIFPWPQPQAVTYASHAHGAGDDPQFLIVRKDGSIDLRNNQHRFYTEFGAGKGIGCYNFRDRTKFRWPKGAISNYSKKGRNRHEFAADNGKNGIAGDGYHAGKDYIGGKKEPIHGTNPTLLKDTKTGHTIKAGDIVIIEGIVFDERQKPAKEGQEGEIWVRHIINMDFGDGLKKVADYYDKDPSPAQLNADLYLNKGSAMWNRYNGDENPSDDEYLTVIEEQIYDLGKEPRQASA